jgi:hypothetical protein
MARRRYFSASSRLLNAEATAPKYNSGTFCSLRFIASRRSNQRCWSYNNLSSDFPLAVANALKTSIATDTVSRTLLILLRFRTNRKERDNRKSNRLLANSARVTAPSRNYTRHRSFGSPLVILTHVTACGIVNSDGCGGKRKVLKKAEFLVAGACNHPNCLVIPFKTVLKRCAA